MTSAPLEDASSQIDAKRFVESVFSFSLLFVETGETDNLHQVITTTGRGGAGNVRSRSREAGAAVEDALRLERQYTKEREAKQGEQIVRTPLPLSYPIFAIHSRLRPFIRLRRVY